MADNLEQIAKASPVLSRHLTNAYQKRLDWIRTTITILTPSLVLLVGLQEIPPQEQILLRCILLITVSSLTLTILLGLWSLFGESSGHKQAAADIKSWVDSGQDFDSMHGSVDFPWHHNAAMRIFPLFSFLSILFLGAFGVLKFYF